MTIFHYWTFFISAFRIFWTYCVSKSKKFKMLIQKKFNNEKWSFYHNLSSPNLKIGKNSILKNWIMFRLNHSIQGQIKNVLHIFNWSLETNLVHTNLYISFIYHYNSNRFALKSSKALLLFLFSQFVLKHALTLYFSSKFKANLFHFFYSSNEIERHKISIWSLFIKIW